MRPRSLVARTRLRRHLALIVAAPAIAWATLATPGALAAPVLHESLTYGQLELQATVDQWALPSAWQPPVGLPARPAPVSASSRAAEWTPFAPMTGVETDAPTNPVAFALLGGLLLVAGLVARALAARQRGLSKKT